MLEDIEPEDLEVVANLLVNKEPEEVGEIIEIAKNNGLDIAEAEHVKEIMDEEGLDEDEVAERFGAYAKAKLEELKAQLSK